MQNTLCIIKPDAIAEKQLGSILDMIEANNLRLVAGKMVRLTPEQARRFYAIHSHRPFFQELVDYMIAGPVFVGVLRGEDAVARYRQLMGHTDPKQADANTIRAKFGKSIAANAVHGSDSFDNALVEVDFFFTSAEILF